LDFNKAPYILGNCAFLKIQMKETKKVKENNFSKGKGKGIVWKK